MSNIERCDRSVELNGSFVDSKVGLKDESHPDPGIWLTDGCGDENYYTEEEARHLRDILNERFFDDDNDDVEWRCLCGEEGGVVGVNHDCDYGQGSEGDVIDMKTPMENNDRPHDHLVTMKDVERTVDDLQAQINVLHAFYGGDDE